ncbi:MAG: threonylcarbamoyl-AMP synthase [Candidatus Omnitrophica bacterium]|nr:threonylcarbamoyl-AMP synthase [Candidatus Omnitrophota bacterium]
MTSIQEAVRFLKEGKPVVFPTETVYGVGVARSQERSAASIYDLKGREENKPLSLHIARIGSLDLKKIYFPRLVSFLIHRFWPGPLTLIIKHRNGETLGYRFPNNPIARQLIEMLGEPMLATSANTSGKPPATTVREAESYFGNKIPVYLDGGKTQFQEASTVLDVTQYPPKLLREGTGAERVREAIVSFLDNSFVKRKILVVCTGNTCRSPMAEGWLRHHLTTQGYADSFEVESCGTAAFSGIPPSDEAIQVLKADGIDISHQRSRALYDELVFRASHIFVMTDSHKKYILELFPEVEKCIAVLNIPDPIGLEQAEYQRVYELIKSKLNKELEWILKF